MVSMDYTFKHPKKTSNALSIRSTQPIEQIFSTPSNGILLLIGESFRMGPQSTRVRGTPDSINGQMDACHSHIQLMNHHNHINWKVAIFSYATPYNELLCQQYTNRLFKAEFLNEPIGYKNIYQRGMDYIDSLKVNYDFVFVIRIDLLIKNAFYKIFNPSWSTIHYPFICFIECLYTPKNFYRVSDAMVFIPKGIPLNQVTLTHESMEEMAEKGFKTNVMINTLHDSDSLKDYNPLYVIVNRPFTDECRSVNYFYHNGTIQFYES
jgi:hypothetical protein